MINIEALNFGAMLKKIRYRWCSVAKKGYERRKYVNLVISVAQADILNCSLYRSLVIGLYRGLFSFSSSQSVRYRTVARGGGSRGSAPPPSVSHLWVGQKTHARPLSRPRGSGPDLDPPPPLKANPGHGPAIVWFSWSSG